MPEGKLKRLTVFLPVDLLDECRKLAGHEALSSWIRRQLEEVVARNAYSVGRPNSKRNAQGGAQ